MSGYENQDTTITFFYKPQGILERMKQQLEMYFLAKHIEKQSKKMNSTHVLKPLTSDVIRSYKKWHKFTSDRKLKIILGNAVTYQYVQETIEQDGNISLKKLELLKSGWKLLDTYPFIPFIPTGLIQAWWREDNIIVKLTLAVIFGASGVFIAHTLKSVYFLVRTIIIHA